MSVDLVIDAGADHRLTSSAAWDQFYGGEFHTPWTYGVPELLVDGVKQRENLRGGDPHRGPRLQCFDRVARASSRASRRA